MLEYMPPGISAFCTSSFGAGKPNQASILRHVSIVAASSSRRAAAIAWSNSASISAGSVSVSGLNGFGSGFSTPKTDWFSSLRISRSCVLIFATASMFTPVSMPSFRQKTWISSMAGAPVPSAKYQQFVSTMSTPATMAASTEASP